MKVERLEIPPSGYNSYDCWGGVITEEIALRQLKVFVEKLKPAGYEYFCFDANWYGYGTYEERLNPENKKPPEIDEYGRYVASKEYFPNGLKKIADACHAAGVKFGVHLFRGIPKIAVERNTVIYGTEFHAQDICDKNNMCHWGAPCYGIDMDKPGAQEYYDSVFAYLDEEEVDFVKYDDIAEQPREIEAVAKALDKARRPMVLSLSPGNNVWRGNWELLKKHANLLRISPDIWDRTDDLNVAFERWEMWEDYGSQECWLDLDMIPIGELQSYIPENMPKDHVPHDLNEKRQSRLTLQEKRTFLTQRALAAAPLLFGGNLEKTSEEDFALVLNPRMLACNRNGVVGKRIYGERMFDIRKSPCRDNPEHGWIGVFSRVWDPICRALPVSALGLPEKTDVSSLRDIWTNRALNIQNDAIVFELQPFECYFLEY